MALAVPDFVRRAGALVLDAVLPPQCLACSATVDAPGRLCARCWNSLAWIAAPFCARCGTPFEFDPAAGAPARALTCAPCLADPPRYDRARAVLVYDDGAKRLVLGFKHADRLHAAPAFGQWLARAGAELLEDVDIVAPVPLHWLRLARRRYNQAALLADALVRAGGAGTVIPDLLLRRRATASQGHLSRRERARNVARAFAVRPRHAARLAGSRVLLVDDVLTTGATVGECAKVLRDAGAARVDVVTLARVVRPTEIG
ncbi:MAG: ComF family protein [Alphaproteobacteria bacterium]|nr:ComF family protein [Alphaproteobacteria bacterium]